MFFVKCGNLMQILLFTSPLLGAFLVNICAEALIYVSVGGGCPTLLVKPIMKSAPLLVLKTLLCCGTSNVWLLFKWQKIVHCAMLR